MSVRNPAVAGMFYPEEEAALRTKVATLLPRETDRRRAIAVLVPHAGYDYSGPVAAAVYGVVEITPEVVLLSFNHRMAGAPVGLWTEGEWRSPLGAASISTELVDRISAAFPQAEIDEAAFQREHSGEVQVPFLQVLRPDVRIAPVSLNTMDRRVLGDFGRALATATGEALVVATTDLTHCGVRYGVPPPSGRSARDWAREQDAAILEPIRGLDIEGFWRVLTSRGVTMCGVAPTAAMIEYARARGATRAADVRYATSADDDAGAELAVGYAGVIVE
ncbi:MAG: AmmeMemoRadiSam system protein B [Planctomycetes bacterium]|nr:AmmeMemoRadiSam system protein B [Planctomycetota bacterium]